MKNFNFFIVALIVGVGFSACSKNDYKPYDPQHYFDLEAPILAHYVDTAAGLEGATLDEETGIWFKVIQEGVKDPEDENYYKYRLNSANSLIFPRLRAKYMGKLVYDGKVFENVDMNDKKFDGQYIYLNKTISAWRAAFFPKEVLRSNGDPQKIGGFTKFGLQKGSKIRIVTPSPYAYQDQDGTGSIIPANSPLDYTIEVLEVTDPTANN